MELPATLKVAWSRWEAFAFAPVDARAVATMRISLGALLLGSQLLLWPQLEPSLELVEHAMLLRHHTPWRISHFDLVEWGVSAHLLHAVSLVCILSFTVGFKTRWSNLLTLVFLMGFWHRLPWVQNGGDRLLRMWTLYMLVAPSGAAWSVDAWLRERRGEAPVTEVPGLVMRLVQLQLMVVYAYTGVDKWMDGTPWRTGSAIYLSMSEGTFNRAPWLLDPVLQSWAGQVIGVALTWATLAWEVFFPPLVIWRRSRMAALWVGVALHLGIFFTMSVGVFGPASVWGYQAYVADRWRRAGGDR